MKRKAFYLSLSILFLITIKGYSQKRNYGQAVFSLKGAKLSLGGGVEYGISPSLMISTSKPGDLKVIYTDPKPGGDSSAFFSGGVSLDLFSENSMIGFLSGVDFTKNNIGFQMEDSIVDFASINRIEIPLFLKLRLGRVLRADGKDNGHVLILLGGSYNIPTKISREHYDLRYSYYTSYTDVNKEQLASNISLSTIIGYEFFPAHNFQQFRVALYLRGSYEIGNQFNNSYSDFQNGGTSVLSHYPGFDVRELGIRAGLKVFFRFGDALSAAASTVLTNVK